MDYSSKSLEDINAESNVDKGREREREKPRVKSTLSTLSILDL